MSSALRTTLLVTAALAASAGQALAQASFTRLGTLPSTSPFSSITSISRDGRAATGWSRESGVMHRVRWSEMDGIVKIAALPPGDYAYGGLSSQGRYATGAAPAGAGLEAYRWSVAGGMQTIGDLPGGPARSIGFAISDDGSVIAGGADVTYDYPTFLSQPFRWSQATGLVGLGYTRPGHDWGEVWAMTPDGSVLVGGSGKYFVEYHGFIWSQPTGLVEIPDVPGGPDTYCAPYFVTPDGQVVVGVCSPPGGYEAFRWTSSTGLVPLGDLPGGDHYSSAYCATDDGEIIVGVADWDGGLGGHKAMIWDAQHGMRSLQQVLVSEHGLDLTGWTLTGAAGISGDGTIIMGEGISPEGHTEAWMVRLPRAGCAADLNGDGLVDFADYLEFLNLYDLGC